ncbi:MAG: hypothetical protein SFV21_21930 [Rhodospirillaceae bacterium]|nr:hypothetical protein [Rhodospirillaceae bacterium]
MVDPVSQARAGPGANPETAPIPGSVSHYRKEGPWHVIDVRAGLTAQLFSSLDPAPFRRKDLDPEVEGYIVAAVREIGGPHQAKLVFHLPAEEAASAAGRGLAEAVHNYFEYRAWAMTQDLRRLMRNGAVSLAIGLVFLFACLVAREFVGRIEGATASIIAEGLLIIGWVAMWRPLEILLYDWWPIWRQRRLYRALQGMPIACAAAG